MSKIHQNCLEITRTLTLGEHFHRLSLSGVRYDPLTWRTRVLSLAAVVRCEWLRFR